MKISDLTPEQVKPGLRFKSLVSDEWLTVVVVHKDNNNYAWGIKDGDNETLYSFYRKNCNCSVGDAPKYVDIPEKYKPGVTVTTIEKFQKKLEDARAEVADIISQGQQLRLEQAKTEIRESVRRGAELLDREMPTWYKRINLDRLDMEDGDNCILGQLFNPIGSNSNTNGYTQGIRFLFYNSSKAKIEAATQHHGFENLDAHWCQEDEFDLTSEQLTDLDDLLQETWVAQVTQRQACK